MADCQISLISSSYHPTRATEASVLIVSLRSNPSELFLVLKTISLGKFLEKFPLTRVISVTFQRNFN